ncbi:MAG: hypothetical protein ACYDIB_07445 [Desulfobulbia bacterium]
MEHFDVVQWLLGAMFLLIMSLVARTLKSVDRNQTELFGRLKDLEKEFYELKGEHRACLRKGK